jgi:hypothetical protein
MSARVKIFRATLPLAAAILLPATALLAQVDFSTEADPAVVSDQPVSPARRLPPRHQTASFAPPALVYGLFTIIVEKQRRQ